MGCYPRQSHTSSHSNNSDALSTRVCGLCGGHSWVAQRQSICMDPTCNGTNARTRSPGYYLPHTAPTSVLGDVFGAQPAHTAPTSVLGDVFGAQPAWQRAHVTVVLLSAALAQRYAVSVVSSHMHVLPPPLFQRAP
jgi:hypothetical protein